MILLLIYDKIIVNCIYYITINIMNFETMEVKRTTREYGHRVFYFYIMEEEDSISCYIQEKGHAYICHCVGVPKEDPIDFEAVINENIEDYVFAYDVEMTILEDHYNKNILE